MPDPQPRKKKKNRRLNRIKNRHAPVTTEPKADSEDEFLDKMVQLKQQQVAEEDKVAEE